MAPANNRLATSINLPPMADLNYQNHHSPILHVADQPIVANPEFPEFLERTGKGFAEFTRVGHRSNPVFKEGDDAALYGPIELLEATQPAPGEFNLPGQVGA